MFRISITFATLAGALLAIALPARAENTQCTLINALPATLSTQGVYCLNQDLSTTLTSGNALTIAANNITLDCNGRALVGTAALATTRTYGIYAVDRYNLTIRNCELRGFQRGVVFDGFAGGGHLIEDNVTREMSGTGIRAQGDSLVVRRNRILNTGGTDAVNSSIGMMLAGTSVQVIDNTISRVHSATRSVYGMYVGVGPGITITGNRILDLAPTTYAWGINIGADDRANAVIDGNLVVAHGTTGGAPYTKGFPITLSEASGGVSLCRNNALLGFDQEWLAQNSIMPLDTCLDGGGNVVN